MRKTLYVVQEMLPGNIVDHYGSPIFKYHWATFDRVEAYRIANELTSGFSIAEQTIDIPTERK